MPCLKVIREPEDRYHARRKQFLTSHQLSDFRRCPSLFHRKRNGLVPEVDSTAFVLGRAAHCFILEGRREFDRRFRVGGGPINPKTDKPYGPNTQKYLAWKATEPREVLTDSQFGTLCSMEASVRGHEAACELLSDGVAEAVVRHDYCGVRSQIRIDWWRPWHIVDLKTCDDVDRFEEDARQFGYLHQLAFYAGVVDAAANEWPATSVIAVEKREPFRTGVWELDGDSLAKVREQNESAIAEMKQCARDGVWPTRYEQVRRLDLSASFLNSRRQFMVALAGFDAEKVEPKQAFEPVPNGKYTAAITASEDKPNSKGTGSYLELEFEILEGEHKGRKLWSRLNLHNPNETAVKIAGQELSAICRAAGVLRPNDSCELHNVPIVIDVRVTKRKDNRLIDQPCVSVYGTTVPEHFYASMTSEGVVDGFLARMLVVEGCDDPVRQRVSQTPVPDALVQNARWWGEFKPGGNLDKEHPRPCVVGHLAEAETLFDEWSMRWESNGDADDQWQPVWARCEEKACRLALVYAASREPETPLVDGEAAKWACEVVDHVTKGMVWNARSWIADGEFDRRQKRVLRVIQNAGRIGRNQLTRKTQWLPCRERNEILSNLIEGGLVGVEEEASGTKPKTWLVATA